MHTGHLDLIVGGYRLTWDHGRPYGYDEQRKQATLVDVIAPDGASEHIGVLAVGDATGGWPFLIVEHSYVIPWTEDTLRIDVLLVPETHLLFVGIHESVLAYDLRAPTRLWSDTADTGFHEWRRYGQVVLMAAELEMAAWDIQGRKLWSAFVEPPYDYTIVEDTLHLTVMGVSSTFPLARGPSWGGSLPWLT